jgi:hypothetical protein
MLNALRSERRWNLCHSVGIRLANDIFGTDELLRDDVDIDITDVGRHCYRYLDGNIADYHVRLPSREPDENSLTIGHHRL